MNLTKKRHLESDSLTLKSFIVLEQERSKKLSL